MSKIFCIDCNMYLGKNLNIPFLSPEIEGIEFKDGYRCFNCAKDHKNKKK